LAGRSNWGASLPSTKLGSFFGLTTHPFSSQSQFTMNSQDEAHATHASTKSPTDMGGDDDDDSLSSSPPRLLMLGRSHTGHTCDTGDTDSSSDDESYATDDEEKVEEEDSVYPDSVSLETTENRETEDLISEVPTFVGVSASELPEGGEPNSTHTMTRRSSKRNKAPSDAHLTALAKAGAKKYGAKSTSDECARIWEEFQEFLSEVHGHVTPTVQAAFQYLQCVAWRPKTFQWKTGNN
jgi:hypothetical protein